MRKLKLSYFKNFWNLFDCWVLFLGFAVILLNLYRTFEVNTVLKDILDNRDKFANFELLAYWQELFNDLVAVACFFTWVKVCCNRILICLDEGKFKHIFDLQTF